MNSKWIKYIRKTGKLKIFNIAKSWALPIEAARKSFNLLNFGVELVNADSEKSANVILKSAEGATTYSFSDPWYAGSLTTKADFDPASLHGLATPALDPKLSEIVFCAIFLPGKVKGATKEQKEMVVIHEFIHACGVIDHEIGGVGIMAYPMQKEGSGLIEVLPEKGAKPMPPIRVGGQTLCAVKSLWSDTETGQKK